MQSSGAASKAPTGGGGADASHGLSYHLAVASLLLMCLKDISQQNPGFEYFLWLEEKGYDKFDDIVLKFRQGPNDQWTEICIQCKHGEEKISHDGSVTVKEITAADFVSGKNKSFSILEYIKSFNIVKNNFKDDVHRFFIILSNKGYSRDKDSEYSWFEKIHNVDINNLLLTQIFSGTNFKIKFSEHFFTQLQKTSKDKLVKDKIEDFCDNFLYICDNNRNLGQQLENKLNIHCRGNEEKIKNIKARIYFLVSEIYQKKRNPTQREIDNEFHGSKVVFKLQSVHPNFTGRERELRIMEEVLKSEDRRQLIDLLITGMAGMGKTQLLSQYLDVHQSNYRHVIWINAENKESIENSFVELAKLCLLIKDKNIPKFEFIISAIYSHFCDDTLFIFDNANKAALLTKTNKNEWRYLPAVKSRSNLLIVVSQDRLWKSNGIVEVGKFSSDEALEFLSKSIEYIQTTEEELQALSQTFDFWPLALCLAASYINQQLENLSNSNFTVSSFLKSFQNHEKEIHEHEPQLYEMEPYEGTLTKLWEMIEINIRSKSEGSTSILILHVFAFTEPDNFPIEFLNHKSFTEEQRQQSITLLKNYSLITIQDDELFIHRTLQSVIRTALHEEDQLSVLQLGQEMLELYFDQDDAFSRRKTKGNVHFVRIWHYILDIESIVQKYRSTPHKIIQKLKLSYDLYIGKQFAIYCIEKLQNYLKSNDLDFVLTKRRYAELLHYMGDYNEAENIVKEVVRLYESTEENNELLISFSRYFLCELMLSKGDYSTAMEEIMKVLEIQNRLLGVHDENTLTSMNMAALALYNAEIYDESLKVYDEVLNVRRSTYGDAHQKTLITMNNKAMVLNDMGKNIESLELYDHVLNVETTNLGKENPATLIVMGNKARVLNDLGRHDEALKLFDHVLKICKDKLGTGHPNVLTITHNKARVLKAQGKIQEALEMFRYVLEKRESILGNEHPHTMKTASFIQEIESAT